jgi:hypothetical protein
MFESWGVNERSNGDTLLEILGFATVVCNWNSVACNTCNCKFVQLPKTSCTWHAVACDTTYATCIYGVSIHVHTYIPIQYSYTLCATNQNMTHV